MKRLLQTIYKKAVKPLVVKSFRRNRIAVSREVVTVGTTPRAKAPFRRIRRMAMAAFLSASRAVNAGISRTEHQTYRLRVYLKNQPHVDYPIPEMRIGDDDQLVVAWPKDRRHTIERSLDDGGPIEGVDALAQGARQEHDLANVEHAKTIARVAELDAQSTDLQREDAAAKGNVTAAISTGTVQPNPVAHRRMPPLSLIIFLRSFEALLMLGESFLTFTALANIGGIDVSNLQGEWQANPWGVTGYALASAACATLLFVITDRVFVAILRAIEQADYDRRQGVKMLAATAGAVLVLGVCAFLTDARQTLRTSADAVTEAFRGSKQPHQQAGPWLGYYLLTLLPLVGAACVDEGVKRLVRRRAEILDERAKPTSEEIATARRRNLRRELESEQLDAQTRADQLAATITLCLAQIRAAEDRHRELAAHEQKVITQFVDDVAACMSKDHYFFTLIARKRGSDHLLRSKDVTGAPQPGGAVLQMTTKRRGRTRAVGTIVSSVLLAIALTRCAKPLASETTVLIVRNAETIREHRTEAQAAYDTWLHTKIRVAGSQFAMYVASPTPGGASCLFRSAIPGNWGKGDVLAAKAAFIRDNRASFASVLEQGRPGPDAANSVPPLRLLTAMILPATDSRGRTWSWMPAAEPVNDLSVCDTSSSGLNHSCTPAALIQAFDDWLVSGATRAGSSFTVVLVGNTLSATKALFVAETPAGSSIDQLTSLLAAREELIRRVGSMPVSGSAVAEAVFVSINLLHERRGIRRLHILSDLREISDDGSMNFESRVPAAEEFCTWMQQRGLSVPAPGVAISVCGVHHEVSPGTASLTAGEMTTTREAWIRALTAMHPASVSICADCATANVDPVDVLVANHNARGRS